MKIELRKLKLNRHLSEETNCYSAELWIDDRKAFLAGNHGHGGPDHYHQVGPWTETEVDAWLKANRPMMSVQGIALEPSLELEVGDLIEEHEQTAALRRKSRSNLISIEDGHVFSRPLKDRGRLPTVLEAFPELADDSLPDDDAPSCSVADALERQSLFVNRVVASHALALLFDLLGRSSIGHAGAFLNLASGQAVPIPLPRNEGHRA